MKTKELENLVEGMTVISETDSPVVAFSSNRSSERLENQSFERLERDDFFAKYAKQNPRWREVRAWFEENLNHLEVRKTRKGNAEFLYEACGYDKDGGTQGIRFITVET